MSQNQTLIIDQVVVVNIEASIWSGRKKLTANDFKINDGSELPPAELASLGSKKICDPESLRIFDTLKKEAQREAGKVGVRFLGGYAIPMAKAEELCAKLDDIQQRFVDARGSFIAEYDKEIDSWVSKHPGWEQSIRSVVPTASHVENRIGFDFQAFEVKTSGISTAGLDRAVGGLAGQLYHEISTEAFNYYEVSLLGKPYGTQKTLRPLRSIRSKLEGLSFLDGKVMPIIDMIDHVLNSLPDIGRIEGTDMMKLCGIVHILSDKDRLLNYSERLLSGATPAELLDPEDEVVDAIDQAEVQEVAAVVPFDSGITSMTTTTGTGNTLDILFGQPAAAAIVQEIPVASSSAEADAEQVGESTDTKQALPATATAIPAPLADGGVAGSLFF
ncbi:DUF3150 domain-containing protein [Crenobacter sp. SG2305]|uniref:DUF3150 domain-containing protein n=1 Tax=Crenobacter oryzisoli TaxID=3056844 RepID=UPI0025AA4D80|nr:DUF3150 domain-containing protein [Crenobacter sp. SG2305]MDN0082504.1 DUF3150 domain-containing protein [Crenobacter sp. SG2305]